MTKKTQLFVAIASVMLATSCSESQDVMGGVNLSNQTIQINPSVGHPSSRAVETNVSNLGSFRVSSFQASQANHMDKVLYSYKDGAWTTDAGKFFWPMDGDLHFYAYAPDVPGAEDAPGTYEITSSSQKLANFSPCASAAEQKDFVYAYAKGNLTDNGTSGVDVDFKHALTEVSIAAKNDNSAYTVEVTGVKLGNIKSKGTFSFPAVGGTTPASWDLSGSGVATYTTTWTTASKLGKAVSSLDASNVAFMLLPQQLATNSKASAGSCIALKVKIIMQGGEVLYNDWAYVGINTNWEMGKHYTYTLDFTSGAGQDEAGKMIISGKDVKVIPNITDWDGKSVTLPDYSLPKKNATANCLILDPTGDKVGKIDVANNINIFWSNPDVGDAANVLDKKSEWVAEVIWQDINSRAINFCNADGNVISGDTYKGIGNQPLYVKAVGGKKGNVVVGVKKKGAGNDAYLWSRHLWITEEPKLVGGFMDRNLGATSANPTDGDKTYGLYYQFGRKDPFTGDINRYDINGTSIGKTTVTSGKVTFAKAMQTPAVFYGYGYASSIDWASPNNYTSKKWNDITDATGKSIFDPSPEGWRLPSKEDYSKFSTTKFTWDSSNKGRTYNTNWFPAAGCRNYGNGSMNNVGSGGYYWSSSPYVDNYGYSLRFYSGSVDPSSNNYRANGFSVRCVQE